MKSVLFAAILNTIAPVIFLLAVTFGLSEYHSTAQSWGYNNIFEACRIATGLPQDECGELRILELARIGAFVALGFGVAVPILMYIVPAILGRSRITLALFFPLALPFAMVATLLISLSSIAFLGLAGHVILTWVFEIMWPYFYIILGLGALFLVWVTLAGFGAVFSATPNLAFGTVLPKSAVPELNELIAETAKELKVKPPKNVVLGLAPNFYITNAETRVMPAKKRLRGRTVFLSATLCRFLNREELKSIIAHELMHYKGGDLTFTRVFFPIYKTIQSVVAQLDASENAAGIFLQLNLAPLHLAFSNAERRISRKRELAADAGAVSVTSPSALAHALSKVVVFSGAWQHALHDNANALTIREIATNPAEAVYGYAVYEFTKSFVDDQFDHFSELRMSHPTDTHPTMSERLDNIGFELSDIERSYFSHYGEHDGAFELREEDLNADLLGAFVQETMSNYPWVTVPEEEDEETANLRNVYRLIYQVMTHFIRADGKTLPEEVKSAEAVGRENFSNFNPLVFREHVHGMEELVPMQKLAELAGVFLTDTGLESLEAAAREIIESDGDIDPSEQKMLDDFLNTVRSGLSAAEEFRYKFMSRGEIVTIEVSAQKDGEGELYAAVIRDEVGEENVELRNRSNGSERTDWEPITDGSQLMMMTVPNSGNPYITYKGRIWQAVAWDDWPDPKPIG